MQTTQSKMQEDFEEFSDPVMVTAHIYVDRVWVKTVQAEVFVGLCAPFEMKQELNEARRAGRNVLVGAEVHYTDSHGRERVTRFWSPSMPTGAPCDISLAFPEE